MSATTTTYRLDLSHWPRPPLSDNHRMHWRQRAKVIREVRETVAWLAWSAGMKPGSHLTVTLIWAPGDRRKRDARNYHATLKACVDALARGPRRDWVGLQLVADDTADYVDERTPVILPPPTERGMWLDVEVMA